MFFFPVRGIRRFARDESNVPGVFVVRGYPRRGDRDGVRTRARVVRAEHLTDQTNAHPAAAARRCSADGRLGRKTGSSNERARRAQVTEAEGQKRSVELAADAQLYEAEQVAKARRIQADAEAYATQVVAKAIEENGLEAAQYQVALKQVEGLMEVAKGSGANTILVPANALEAFGDAFKMLKGRG